MTVSLRNVVRPGGANLSLIDARLTHPTYQIWTKPNKQQPHGCERLHFSRQDLILLYMLLAVGTRTATGIVTASLARNFRWVCFVMSHQLRDINFATLKFLGPTALPCLLCTSVPSTLHVFQTKHPTRLKSTS